MDREILQKVLKEDFLGPQDIDGESNPEINPAINYLAGILEPIYNIQNDEADIDRLSDAHSSSSNSSVGVSSLVHEDDILRGKCSFVIYQSEGRSTYKASRIEDSFEFRVTDLNVGTNILKGVQEDSFKSLDLYVTKIPSINSDYFNVIVSLVNSATLDVLRRPKVPELYFQIEMSITSELGFNDLKASDLHLETRDDRLNALLYEEVEIFAKGHGISVDWELESSICRSKW